MANVRLGVNRGKLGTAPRSRLTTDSPGICREIRDSALSVKLGTAHTGPMGRLNTEQASPVQRPVPATDLFDEDPGKVLLWSFRGLPDADLEARGIQPPGSSQSGVSR